MEIRDKKCILEDLTAIAKAAETGRIGDADARGARTEILIEVLCDARDVLNKILYKN